MKVRYNNQEAEMEVPRDAPVGPTQGSLGMFKLQFKVIYCSGSDPEHPVNQLLETTPDSVGWLSPKFCDYPQEIIFQFTNIVRLKQIQFLAHQSKIPAKMELYTFIPSGRQALNPSLPLTELQFSKLGFLALDDNSQSNYQARELKSVYVDAVALLLKVKFTKCHVNKYNLYSQVGLVGVNMLGEMYAKAQGNEPRAMYKNPENIYDEAGQTVGDTGPTLEEEMNIDKTTMQTIRQLYAAKERAVMLEDFAEAKRMKETIERVRSMAHQLAQLEERKKRALKTEDFDSATLINDEVRKLKATLIQPNFEQPGYPPQFGKLGTMSVGGNPVKEAPPIPQPRGSNLDSGQVPISSAVMHQGDWTRMANADGSQAGVAVPQGKKPHSRLAQAGAAMMQGGSSRSSIDQNMHGGPPPPRGEIAVRGQPPSPGMGQGPPPGFQPAQVMNQEIHPAGPSAGMPSQRTAEQMPGNAPPFSPPNNRAIPLDDGFEIPGGKPGGGSGGGGFPGDKGADHFKAQFDSEGGSKDTPAGILKRKPKSKKSGVQFKPPSPDPTPAKPTPEQADPFQSKPGASKGPDPDKESLLKEADGIVQIFGEEPTLKLYDPKWGQRKEGLDDIERYVSEHTDDQETFKAAIRASTLALQDKVQQVVNQGLSLGESAMNFNQLPADPGNTATPFYHQLLDRLGDNNPRIRDKAEQVLIQMSDHHSFGPDSVASHLTKGMVRKKTQGSLKHITGRLDMMHKVIQKHGINANSRINYKNLLEYAVGELKHQNQEIRNSAQDVVCDVYKEVGRAKVQPYLGGLRQAQMESLQGAFKDIDNGVR